MNKRALIAGLLYSMAAITFKLIILLGGYTLMHFWFLYSNTLAIFLIIPFFFLAIYWVREKDLGGVIGGKEALRVALTVLAVGVIVVSAYHLIAFNWKYKELAIEYYNGKDFLKFLTESQIKNPTKLKVEQFPIIIEGQIAALSPMRDTTAKLFPFLVIGLTASFLASVMMKKSSR